jgi:hypothetical protein
MRFLYVDDAVNRRWVDVEEQDGARIEHTSLTAGPSVSTIAGALPLGLMARKAGACCSPLLVSTGMTS